MGPIKKYKVIREFYPHKFEIIRHHLISISCTDWYGQTLTSEVVCMTEPRYFKTVFNVLKEQIDAAPASNQEVTKR